ncbi:hypothetical protein ACWEHA_02245 [Amycolatopsis nivea]
MSTPEDRDLLGDRFVPKPHFSLVRHAIVDAPVEQTYAAARALDLTEIHSGLAAAAGWLRELPARWQTRRHGPPRRPTRLTVDDLAAGTEWTLLGEHPGSEFALGVAGKFWRPVIVWHRVEPAEFAEFSEPGWGKLVLTVGVRPYGAHRSLLTLDTRVLLTDPPSWLKFRRYWRVASPFALLVHGALLRTIAQDARQRALDAYRREDD